MKRIIILSLLISQLLVTVTPQNPISGQAIQTIIRKYNDSIPSLLRDTGVPGLSLAVVTGGSILWAQAYGVCDTISNTPVDTNTVFSLQSISKNLTAMSVLAAVNEGYVDLDEPVTTYLPGFKVNSRWEESPESKITLRLLLSHRAGFTHEAPVGSNYDLGTGSFSDHIASISDTWLRFPVGQRFSYSNLGVDLAAWIIEQETGIPFPEYMKSRILEPAGLSATSCDLAAILKNRNRATGKSNRGGVLPVEVPMIGAGGVYSSAADMARYIQLHLNGGRYGETEILPGFLLDEMYSIPDKHPLQIFGYGLGTGISREFGTTVYNHGGGGYGFLTNILWLPEYNIGCVILTNSSNHNFQNSLPVSILADFIDAMGIDYIENYDQGVNYSDSLKYDQSANGDFSGRYLYNRGGWMIVERENERLGFISRGVFRPMTFISSTMLLDRLNGINYLYELVRDSDGKPSHIIRLYDGEHLDFCEGNDEAPGPGREYWNSYTGKYGYRVWGVESTGRHTIEMRNGYLWLNGRTKLVEFIPGLFFTPNGEAFDLRPGRLSYRNIPLFITE